MITSKGFSRVLRGTGRALALSFFLLFVLLPLYWMAVTAFKTNPEIINAQELTYFPRSFTLENFTGLFEQFNFATLLKNSLIVSLSSGVLVTVLSIFGGYSLARYQFRSKDGILIFFLVTQMIPGILVIIPLNVIFSRLRVIDSYYALLIFYLVSNLPFCLITMRSFFERIPKTLEEAAAVDGCGKLAALRKVIIPIMFPGIVSVFVFAFIGAWNELIAGTIFISTPKMWTIPVGLKSLIGKYNVQWGALMAGGVLALLPTAILFGVMQKYVVSGLTAGAVKE